MAVPIRSHYSTHKIENSNAVCDHFTFFAPDGGVISGTRPSPVYPGGKIRADRMLMYPITMCGEVPALPRSCARQIRSLSGHRMPDRVRRYCPCLQNPANPSRCLWGCIRRGQDIESGARNASTWHMRCAGVGAVRCPSVFPTRGREAAADQQCIGWKWECEAWH